MEPAVGIEPTTCRLQGGCSGQLSYTGEVGSIVGAIPGRSRPEIGARAGSLLLLGAVGLAADDEEGAGGLVEELVLDRAVQEAVEPTGLIGAED